MAATAATWQAQEAVHLPPHHQPQQYHHSHQQQPQQQHHAGHVGQNLSSLDDRTYQLALELSLLGLDLDHADHGAIDPAAAAAAHSLLVNGNMSALIEGGLISDARAAKKSQNTTECVPVPSSEHVAEIVGRQGCKIKALRAKTNTYIKTPVRGEEPVFVVTGRKEDVQSAKKEILSAADHFSQIRAQRKNNANGNPNANMPGQTTIQVRVPYRVVGLVVGPKGATIKRIQQNTSTYIITPSRDKEPIFEVTGLPDNVDVARKEIEQHIQLRTGGIVESGSTGSGAGSSSGSTGSGSDLAPLNGIMSVDGHMGLGHVHGDHFSANGLLSRSDSLFSSASYDIFKNGNGGSLSVDLPFGSHHHPHHPSVASSLMNSSSVISSTSTLVSSSGIATARDSTSFDLVSNPASRRNSNDVFFSSRLPNGVGSNNGVVGLGGSGFGSAGSSAGSTSSGSGSPGVAANAVTSTKLSQLYPPTAFAAYTALLNNAVPTSIVTGNGSDSDEGLGSNSP